VPVVSIVLDELHGENSVNTYNRILQSRHGDALRSLVLDWIAVVKF
jgi:hypothetical protein